MHIFKRVVVIKFNSKLLFKKPKLDRLIVLTNELARYIMNLTDRYDEIISNAKVVIDQDDKLDSIFIADIAIGAGGEIRRTYNLAVN